MVVVHASDIGLWRCRLSRFLSQVVPYDDRSGGTTEHGQLVVHDYERVSMAVLANGSLHS